MGGPANLPASLPEHVGACSSVKSLATGQLGAPPSAILTDCTSCVCWPLLVCCVRWAPASGHLRQAHGPSAEPLARVQPPLLPAGADCGAAGHPEPAEGVQGAHVRGQVNQRHSGQLQTGGQQLTAARRRMAAGGRPKQGLGGGAGGRCSAAVLPCLPPPAMHTQCKLELQV